MSPLVTFVGENDRVFTKFIQNADGVFMKRMLKKTALFVMLTVFLTSAFGINVFASDFPDMPRTHKNYTAVSDLVELGVIAGYDDGYFRPEREITRTEFCALMARTLGYTKDTYDAAELPFSDVKPGYWGIDYISFCYELGLVNGMGNGEFWPAEKVTVEQATKMAVCAIGKEAEAQRISGDSWYSGYVETAKAYDLFYKVEPEFGKPAVRGDIAQIVYNMIETGFAAMEEDESSSGNKSDEELNSEEASASEEKDTDGDEAEEEGKIPPEILEAYRQKDYLDVKTILIDAGHNYSGLDTGAENRSLGLKEEEITWQIADKLRNCLENMGYAVVMTRESITDSIANTSVVDSLSARVELGHTSLADLFISIHCNAGGGSGTEVYCFNTDSYAGKLAKLVQKNITDYTGLYNRGVKTANFYVIQNTLMPAILIETGFIDSSRDAEVLASEEGQTGIAEAVAAAVKEYDETVPAVETAQGEETENE